jgi:hypothetical protein
LLYVDGQVADENVTGPFDTFTWDLSGYTTSGQHLLQVEAVDSLGLSKTSVGVPVTVTVIQPPSGWQGWLSRNAIWVIGGTTLAAGTILALVIILGGQRRRAVKASPRSSKDKSDLLTQPVVQRVERRPSQPPRVRQKAALASLVRLNDEGQPVTAAPIPLSGEITFGNDPTKANIILDDPSVAPLHARIKQSEDGLFYIRDEKSVAGTWVNFESLKDAPRLLEHGDFLHFGRLSYRFILNHPPQRRAPRISSHKP